LNSPRLAVCDFRDDDERRTSVAKLAAQRRPLARRIVHEGVSPAERTIAADAVADEFVDRLIFAMQGRSYLPVVRWVDETRERYREVVPVHSMLAQGARGVSSILRVWETPAPRLAGELDSLADAIDATLLRWHFVPSDAATDVEIDVDIDRLLIALGACDRYTKQHSRAVAADCGMVARLLSVSDAGAQFVARCGALHDVGKSQVPLEILTAPRALTPFEWTTMKEHSAAGAEIVGAIESLRPFARIVRAHHERFDGRGYPDGLSGSRIPLAARIVAVVDAFHAMIDERPYSTAVTIDEAIAELQRHAGTQFDPIAVEGVLEAHGFAARL
jgi:putative nucleotidyltransferase with HDIG domain